MKKIIILVMVLGFLVVNGCTNINSAMNYQNSFFDEKGNPAGKEAGLYSKNKCMKQAKKESHNSNWRYCVNDNKCRELLEVCLLEHGYFRAKDFETTQERMEIYQKAYEEGWIKPGMTRLEVISLIGAPQIYTYQLIPPRKIWMYCKSATKTAFIGYNFIFQITWYEDKVESAERKFKI